jgi:Zn-dependent protease
MGLNASDLILVIPALVIAMAFHEATHAFTSHWLGDSTARDLGRLTLNPLKHIDIYLTILLPVLLIAFGMPPILAAKPVPFNPARVKYDEFGAALVGVAGPFSNLLMAAIAGLLFRVVTPEGMLGNFLVVFVVLNCLLFVFNMIPLPPLDGSRLLYAIAPEPLQKLMYTLENMGFLFTIMILLLLLPIINPVIQNSVDVLLKILLF